MVTKIIAQYETQKTTAAFTPWSIVHGLVGACAKKYGVRFWWWQGLHALYEVKDQFRTIEERNSLLNTVGDQVSTTAGYMLAPAWVKPEDMLLVTAIALAGFSLAGDKLG